MSEKPVFFDPTGKRSRRFNRWIWALLAILTGVAIVFAVFIAKMTRPSATDLEGAARSLFELPLTDASIEHPRPHTAERTAAELRARERELARGSHFHVHGHTKVRTKNGPVSLEGVPGRALSIGFYVNWDDNSLPSLKRALPKLDWVVPSWLSLQGPQMQLKVEPSDRAIAMIDSIKPDIPVLPMIQNATDGQWDGPGLARFLADPEQRTQRIADIVAYLQENKMQGLVVDFETVPPAAQKNLRSFLVDLSNAFDAHGWIIVLAVPFDDAVWDYKAYADVVDYLLLMAYDQHWEEGAAGPIAAQQWFEDTLDKRMKMLDPDQVIIAIGNYGYDWSKGQTTEDITYQEAVRAAKGYGADIDFDEDAANPHFSYTEDGKKHEVWFLDGVTAFNQIHAADPYRPFGYAVWRLGSEDPSIWSVMARPYGASAPDALKTIGVGSDVEFEGNGEILRIASDPAQGQRTLELDPDTGDIVDQVYSSVPMSYVIQRFGAVPKKIALTFDDGPDPEWTPKILDVLKEKKVRASFFIVGENAGAQPELVRRLVDEQHDVGNHSFTHPNLALLSPRLVQLELNSTRGLFEAETGRSMRLFRPPYFGDAEPTTLDEILPVQMAQEMGFVTVGLRVDPDDWLRPGAVEIVKRVLDQVSDPNPEIRGQVVLLHDAGGDRSQTVEALPMLIDALRQRGYELVPVSELAGLTRDQVMPPLQENLLMKVIVRPVFLALGRLGEVFQIIFMTAIGLGLARLAFLCVAGAWHRWHEKRQVPPELPVNRPLISVIIPAFNEAKVIASSVERILGSQDVRLEVIVIDDGSTDGTSDVVRRDFGNHPDVRLITIANGGKARALNLALAEAHGNVVIALDADTQFEPLTIARLARWFADPSIAAVAGNAKVGNRINTITRWQALEYISAQNLERRALASLGCITVVPGAVGAWRKRTLDELGGFPSDTLAEDQDLTLAVQKAGYRVIYDSTAIAWTEAPDSIRSLAKQRFRWAFGTLQCLWKHRGMFLRPRYGTLGMIALPQVLVFQIGLSVLSPIVDLALLSQVARTALDYLQHGSQFDMTNLTETVAYFALFTGCDIAAVALAFSMETSERWSLMLPLPFQRFGYRQILYYVVLKSLVSAMAGAMVGWGKLERKATVKSAGS